jgi:hypothetical protein
LRARFISASIGGLALLATLTPSHGSPSVHEPGTIAVVHQSESTNWSGYGLGVLSHAAPYTQVAGDWTVPTATRHKANEAEFSAAWIGIGGGCMFDGCSDGGVLVDQTLIQTGTDQNIASDGTASYDAWYELIPSPPVYLLPSQIGTITPGNHMQASIQRSSDLIHWSITIKNVTTGRTYTTSVAYPSSMGTAEWVLETPLLIGTGGTGIAAMPNLSGMKFYRTVANGSSVLLGSQQEIYIGGSPHIAQPSDPGPPLTDFNVCTYADTCSAPTS